ncbi:MAG: transcription elongation factor GreA [Eubacterium sp.]|nr:transcription elongation factor GreA [Eubacterium sp.]MCR5291704.1 transcription elongation factor GreA [Eubacterium sp.]
MEGKKNILTYEGLKKLEEELQDLKVNKRQEIAQKIKEAREQGDLSENAEYDAAKDEQRDIEARISEIEKILKNVEVVDEDSIDKETVNFGCTVKIKDMKSKKEMKYMLVGSTEADILNGKISNESPLGSALMGAKKGQIISVEAPKGRFDYKVLDFTREN